MVYEKINRKVLIACHDLFMTSMAWHGAWLLRFNFEFPYVNFGLSLYSLPIVLLVQALVFYRFKLYNGIWHFASLPDLWNIFRAVVIGALNITLVLFLWIRLEGIPRSILALYPILLMFFLGGPRLTYRMWRDHSFNLGKSTQGKRILVVGAGAAADTLVRYMLREGSMQPVALVDDSPGLIGSEIHGIDVVGDTSYITTVCEDMDIDIIVIAIPSATNRQMQAIVSKCEETGCVIRVFPGVQGTMSGKTVVNELREVMIEDLLGRDKVRLDWLDIKGGIDNKRILVTGGGGSIGSGLCNQIASLSPAMLIILDQSEYNLYRIEQGLAKYDTRVNFILGNICDSTFVDKVVAEYKPHVIYHAAAYKHVPILQRQPYQAMRNNILGTKNMVDVASKYGCERFVLISTDKAVNPTSVLGVSKRIAEMYTEIHNAKYKTKYMTVRFGNVLDSDGSVVPLFRKQIRSGGPVTVTHPDIMRYFMTIPEACQLIMQASTMGNGGEIFVLDMGDPVRISFLAEQMICLSGLTPDEDIKITYTGLRPGEKMYEELFYATENRENTSHKKIFIARHPASNTSDVCKKIENLIGINENTDDEILKSLMQEIVPCNDSHNDNVIAIKSARNL